MDSVNLKTASAYLNNLLLARGLLRNGKPIEFARPHKAEGGTEATMAEIINLMHDMVLRKDREQEQRDSHAQTVRSLGSDLSQSNLALSRLQATHDETLRQLSLAQSQERSAKATARTAESTAKGLRDELLRLKASVAQIRASCANDIRKRDVQIQKLKTHLTTQQRGNRTALHGTTITINPGTLGAGSNVGREEESPGVDDSEYSLKQETTEFLTQLSQSLSDENDNLIGLVRSTLGTLREIQGLPETTQRSGLPVVPLEEQEAEAEDKMLQALPISYDALASDMDHVLGNLRNILTSPNFVPIEEVAIREEEITKLRSGWDKMEMRWKEAIMMMDGWRTRMANGGDTVNIEEIKRGLGLGRDLNIRDTTMMFTASVGPIGDSSDMEDDESFVSDTQDLSDSDDPTGNGRTGTTLQARLPRPLVEKTGNNQSPKKVMFKGDDQVDENARHRCPSPRKAEIHSSLDSGRTRKRLSSPSPHADERSPKLTVQEKLNVAQAEAEAAAVAAGLNLDDIEVKVKVVSKPEVEETIARHGVKKTRIGGRPRRRKSTLTPDELERLMYNN